MIQEMEYYLENLAVNRSFTKEEKESLLGFLQKEGDNINMMAERIALYLGDRALAVFSEDSFIEVLYFFRKVMAKEVGEEITTYAVPSMVEAEMNTWNKPRSATATIFLRDKGDAAENQLKVEVVRELIRKRAASIIEVKAKGETSLQRKIYAMHFAFQLARAITGQVNSESRIWEEYDSEIKRLLG